MSMRTKLLALAIYLALVVVLAGGAVPSAGSATSAVQQPGPRGLSAVSFSPDGRTVASGGVAGEIVIWDASRGQRLQSLPGHEGAPITDLTFSPRGATLASVARDSTLRVWDVASGAQLQLLQGHEHPARAVAVTDGGEQLASGGEDGRVVIWDVDKGAIRHLLQRHRGPVNSLAFNRDASVLASAGDDGRIIIWDTATGALLQTLLGHNGPVNTVVFAPNGRTLMSTGSDGTVRRWNSATGEQERLLKRIPRSVRAAALSADGATLANDAENNEVVLLDADTGQERLRLRAHTAPVTALSFSPDGKELASVGEDGLIVVWDVRSGSRRWEGSTTPTAPSGQTGAAAAVPDSRRADETGAADTGVAAVSAAQLTAGPGGPILVVYAGPRPFGTYYAEILRNEGLNLFDTAELGTVTASSLTAYDLVLLAETPLSAAQVTMLSDWVSAGGNLIAMRPDKQLAGLLGLADAGGTLSEGYLRIDTASAPGNGLVGETLQYHGVADRYTLSGARAVATLFSGTTQTVNPAVTLRAVGTNGGHAAAFTYDLARSVVYTRQGNPAWAGQERDGFAPIRSDDLYFGAAAGDSRPDWVDLSKVAIPQADEQQRLLANLILQMNSARKPLPRLWYFPSGHKAVVIMTGDDHANGGTPFRFDQQTASSPAGCSVEDWECIRSTSYIYPNTPLTDAQALAYSNAGFEIALHVNTGCQNFTSASLQSDLSAQLAAWRTSYPSLASPVSQRTHCLVWSDWNSTPQVELANGMRLDTSYYYWPPSWVQDRPGYFTGSGMPMRFVDQNGTLIDVYQAATQNTDESGQSYPFTVNSQLDKALGPEGYYAAITVNAHTDAPNSGVADAVIGAAAARGIPVVSARQMLTWLDGRNASRFSGVSWSGSTLSFTLEPGPGARNLRVMLPARAGPANLSGIARGGANLPYTVQTIKGIAYASFAGEAGAYSVSYATDTTAPMITARNPAAGASQVNVGATVSATFSEPMDPATISAVTVGLRDAADAVVPAAVSYDAATQRAVITPTSPLAPSSSFTARIRGGAGGVADSAGNTLAADTTWSFTTAAGPNCPCTIWDSSATPAIVTVNDPNGVELGVKFRPELSGQISGLRFYRGPNNNGPHVGSLWTMGGARLAQVTFPASTTAGWQQASFATPVPVQAGVTYIASYYAPGGNYSITHNGLSAGITRGPLRALGDVEAGGNGVYRYGGGLPDQAYQASNYWVDVVFATGGSPVPTPTPASPTPTSPTPTSTPGSGGGPCAAPPNPIVAENCRPGNPPGEWDISGIGDPSIQGFATDISVNKGEQVSFKIDTTASSYRIDIYRLGYYGGLGARKVASIPAGSVSAVDQPACLTEASTGLVDCGNWSVSASWQAPGDAVSGIYIARPVRTDNGGASHIVFVVRDDGGNQDLLFQTSDTTWQAYNSYGGNSLYAGGPGTNPGRAYKVSYNRPFNSRVVDGGQDYLFSPEYPMVRWLERNGYNVAYFTGVDSDRRGSLIRNHNVFLSVGHDEYWSAGQRANVEAARNAGVDLAFFSGNEVYWKTRWERSIDGSGTSYRTLVSYKESHNDAGIDPASEWTGLWRDPRFSPPADGGRPENGLTGQIFGVNEGATSSISVPAEDGKLRFWRHTSIATLAPGSVATLPFGTLGYEWDVVQLDGSNPAASLVAAAHPAGQLRLSTTTINNAPLLRDYGSNGYQNSFSPGTATHHLTLYRHSSGALVFGAGTVQWAWGLDATHDLASTPADPRMQQATVNLLADMGVQPATLQAGLVQASASTDTAQPNTIISAPAAGATIGAGQAVTVSGTASDSGGVVGVVEVSTDNGATWRRANGRGSWSASVTAPASGSFTILARAVDDSMNSESTPASVALTVGAATCPCSLWSDGTVPSVISDPDSAATELGVKFSASANGQITGLRFYKGLQNTGTHTGSLWAANGTLLARATFTNETASGWQTVSFTTPVAITAGQVYVASYHAPNGKYSQDGGYFTTSYSNGPLRALADGESGPNGVYLYSTTPAFPTLGYNAFNSYVDVVFVSGGGGGGGTPTPTSTSTPTSTPVTPPPANINLLTNGSFETDANSDGRPDGWSSDGRFTRSAEAAQAGAFAGRHSAADNSGYTISQAVSGITPGKGYAFSGWVNIPATADTFTFRLQLRWLNGSGGTLATTTLRSFTAASAGWVQTTSNQVAPAGAASAQLLMVASNLAATIYVDNFALEASSRLANGGFEWDANGDTRPDSWSSSAHFSRATDLLRSGAASGLHAATNNANYTISQTVNGLTAGATYSVGGWVNIPATSDSFTFTIDVQWRDAANLLLRTDVVRSFSGATARWEQASAALTAPPGATRAVVRMGVTSLNARIYVDDLALE